MEELLRTANKGEWAELYVFFKILADRIVYAADKDLQPIEDEWFKFIKIYRPASLGKVLEFDLSKEGNIVISNGENRVWSDIDLLKNKTARIFERIQSSSSTFSVSDATDLMDAYGIKSVKAGSTSKTDIDADVIVSNNPSRQRMGFSVKSYMGGAPTLVNSSSHTNFIYEVTGYEGDIDDINSIDGRSKVRDRMAALTNKGASLKFDAISSSTFMQNLRLQDSSYPKVLAEMLRLFYSGHGNDFCTLGKIIAEDDSHDSNESELIMMTKRYLRSSALGMVPGTAWTGTLSTQGGYIVVLDSGDLLCYNVYFDDEFRDYLYSNTRFDTPSTKKYKFGKLYYSEGKLCFNLNLQIRFKSLQSNS